MMWGTMLWRTKLKRRQTEVNLGAKGTGWYDCCALSCWQTDEMGMLYFPCGSSILFILCPDACHLPKEFRTVLISEENLHFMLDNVYGYSEHL